ncbi:MAG: sensor histidine kinase [Xenococcaceae cyanobacterium MO_188.B32]|nr:sensor histidine kinase [Xenococcaceae cyanobacterium MO_188.B32]
MAKLLWKKHPFRLLLYLEWVLLGIVLVASLIPHPHHHFHPDRQRTILHLAAILSIAMLGVMGLRLPYGSQLLQKLYISSGFGLSWIAVLLGGRGGRVFPTLLLIVVIRACLLFSWNGRIFVAIFSYASFLLVQIISFLGIRPFGIPLGRPFPRLVHRLPSEELQNVLIGLTINSALWFGLVLTFVLLLVGAVLAEHESQKKLAIANHRLRQYALAIENQAILQERNRIAREIHDSVGHYLTAQSIQLENTALFLATDREKAAYHLQNARQLGKDALQNVRQSVATLRNHPLKGRSLKIAIEQLVEEFKRNSGIAIAFSLNLLTSPSMEVTTALYRILQEALTNISKHSNATQVHLTLTEQNSHIYLHIKDNGKGFNPAENTTGFGLQGMRERTEALDGKFELTSKPQQGCEIRVEIENK